jgi:hypothetical protein
LYIAKAASSSVRPQVYDLVLPWIQFALIIDMNLVCCVKTEFTHFLGAPASKLISLIPQYICLRHFVS